MPNEYVNKVILGNGTTLIDLTADDALVSDVLSGKKFHTADGAPATGTCTYDADTRDATAVAAEILNGKTAYKAGAKLTGTMPNNGSVSGAISSAASPYVIPQGYHDGGGSVGIAQAELLKLIPGNIKAGVVLLGVTGDYGGQTINVQTKSATPTFSQQTIVPDSGYDYLSQVTVAAIPVVYTDNAAGGQTCTIG